ncbi:cupin domain-containing protein [Rubrivivax rivuli]|uniref:Cupin domain-containing protein n=1 Tax=Rubrivivax rivuli TaxID=1862385 RepID=A0A437RHF3_9BURK|nr:cupin domain-containing protein [Rubrivivax rivuli]RVU46154.1 cupin domain-containing protein [Rubrivivax rivuli]
MSPERCAELIATLGLQPHPEGGHYGEVFRSALPVRPADGREGRIALTTIDFLLQPGQCSAWHRVASDEVWHLLEGQGLRLWLAPPDLSAFTHVDLGPVAAVQRPRHVVPAGWWQAAEPLGGGAYVGATVGPGFEFADFSFGREDAAFRAALQNQPPGTLPDLQRLL